MEMVLKVINGVLCISFIISFIRSLKKDEEKEELLKRVMHSFFNGSVLAITGILMDNQPRLIVGLVLVASSGLLYDKTKTEIKKLKETKGSKKKKG